MSSFVADSSYVVQNTDTLERIAACNDCTPSELIKLNRLPSRTVFPGQTVRIPPRTVVAPLPPPTSESVAGVHQPVTTSSSVTFDLPPQPAEEREAVQRFLKLKVKQFTDTEGVVSGTLLITPNCLMFDPDVSHPLVKENGADLYGMVAPMEEIVSVVLYKDISALTGEACGSEETLRYLPPPSSNADDAASAGSSNARLSDQTSSDLEQIMREEEVAWAAGTYRRDCARASGRASDEEDEYYGGGDVAIPPLDPSAESAFTCTTTTTASPCSHSERRATVNHRQRSLGGRLVTSMSLRRRPPSTTEPPSPRKASRDHSLSAIRKTLSARATNLSDSLQSGVEKVADNFASGMETMVDGVSKGGLAVVEGVSKGGQVVAEGAQTMATGVVTGTKAAADTLTRFADVPDKKTPAILKREQSLARLETLKHKARKYREGSLPVFHCATNIEERPQLFLPVQELLLQSGDGDSSSEGGRVCPQLPYYMCVRLTRKRRRPRRNVATMGMSENGGAFGNKLKRAFWFTVPREKAHDLYSCLLEWSPEKYGGTQKEGTADAKTGRNSGFLVLDSNETDAELIGVADMSSHFGAPIRPLSASMLNREWEIVTVEEVCRRLSLSELSPGDLPIPDGALASKILPEERVRQLLEVLPARAESYPWLLIYSAAEHGFSLRTLYRKMTEWREDSSPSLLVVRDASDRIFGAIVSHPIRPSDHFYGTGDASMLFTFGREDGLLKTFPWTGNNQFFIKASHDGLAIGAGHGKYGLWLDADLNHGRTQKCLTFDNSPLADHEDFIVVELDVFGFAML